MNSLISLIGDIITRYIGILNSININIGSYTVGVFDIVLGLLIISMVVTVFWKGAKG